MYNNVFLIRFDSVSNYLFTCCVRLESVVLLLTILNGSNIILYLISALFLIYLDIEGVPLKMASSIRFRNLGVVYMFDSRSCCHSVETREAANNADESR